MGKKRNLNGLPGNLALSYLSTLGYYNGGYMADWINHIARKNGIDKMEIDILNKKITPIEFETDALLCDLEKLKGIILTEVKNNGFEMEFIKSATMRFEIPINSPIKHTIYCYPEIEDESGKIYKPKKRIIETAYEVAFNPTERKVKKSWFKSIRSLFE